MTTVTLSDEKGSPRTVEVTSYILVRMLEKDMDVMTNLSTEGMLLPLGRLLLSIFLRTNVEKEILPCQDPKSL